MKKYRMILLLLLSAVLLAGCGKKADPGERPAATPTPVIVETPEPTPTPSSAPTPAAASTQTPAGHRRLHRRQPRRRCQARRP